MKRAVNEWKKSFKNTTETISLPVLIGIGVIALGIVIFIVYQGVILLFSDNFSVSTDSSISEQSKMSENDQSSSQKSSGIFIHVAGSVNSPGVYELTKDARVFDAIEKAGGFSEDADTSSLNLARILTDGEQIVVSSINDSSSSSKGELSGSSASSSSSSSTKVNINTADSTELETLPGIGASTAQKIIADREANGRFGAIEDLQRVSGIGEKKFAALKDFICV